MGNSNGPSIEPCGIPNCITTSSDIKPFIVTNCILLMRYDSNNLFAIPLSFWEVYEYPHCKLILV